MRWFRKNRGPYMWTYSGRLFYPLDPRVDEIHIEDIAVGLSNECRFAGQCDFYSVAEHSLLISQLAEKYATAFGWEEWEVHAAALWGLLHDATEAYIGDIIRPLKYTKSMRGYVEFEQKVDAVIRRHFSKWLLTPSYVEDLVRKLDTQILADESEALILNPDPKHVADNFGKPLKVEINCYSPNKACELFLTRFNELVSDYA